jgi:hypothetical protein
MVVGVAKLAEIWTDPQDTRPAALESKPVIKNMMLLKRDSAGIELIIEKVPG